MGGMQLATRKGESRITVDANYLSNTSFAVVMSCTFNLPLGVLLFRGLCPKAIAALPEAKTITKGRKTSGTTHLDQRGCLREPSRVSDSNPAKRARVYEFLPRAV
jgi:hypothetical protein